MDPVLFSIYENDLPLHIPELCELFCNDTTIHTSHQNLYNAFKSLQVCVDKLSTWFQLKYLSLSPSKTKLVVMATRQKRQNTIAKLPILLVEKEPIEIVDSHRVLGVVIDNNLIWHDHLNSVGKNLSRKVHQLFRVIYFLNLHARKVFLHVHIISVISYCSRLFDSASEKVLEPLLSVYKRAIKAVLFKSTSVVISDYADIEILPIEKLFASNKAIPSSSSRLCPSTAGCSPPSMSSIVVCLLLS